MAESSKKKMGGAIDIIRRGGVILKEPCPHCGGVQLGYKQRTICVNCGDLSEVAKTEAISVADTVLNLRDLIIGKIQEATDQLARETDVEKQTQLANLLLKYIEIVDKTSEESKQK